MSIGLRVVLLVAALCSSIWILRRIRKAKVRLEDTLYWVAVSLILAVLGLFPQVSYAMAHIVGFVSPTNFVFFVMICLLFEKVLTLSIMHSQMEDKYTTMVAEMALRCKNLEDEIDRLKNAAAPEE